MVVSLPQPEAGLMRPKSANDLHDDCGSSLAPPNAISRFLLTTSRPPKSSLSRNPDHLHPGIAITIVPNH
jgi:hypothetical protein